MPRIITGLRVARSMVSPTGAAVVSRELDFQLGSDQGIQIESVLGGGIFHDDSPAASDTVPAANIASQSLHFETGTLEDFPIQAAEDADDIDTEIFWGQTFAEVFQVPATAGGGGGFGYVTPTGITVFANPLRTARNITHRGETAAVDLDLEAWVLIYYRYIQFTRAELGLFLARRQ